MKQKLLHIIVAIGLLTVLGNCKARQKDLHVPTANQGILSLKQWNFEQNPLISLEGAWEFYWQKYLFPQDFRQADGPKPYFATLPGIWTEHQIPKLITSPHGYATYRLQILLPPNTPTLALKVPTVSIAYNLYINGKKRSVVGQIGTTKQQNTPEYRPLILDIPSGQTTLDVVIQVANFHHRKGGLWRPLQLGATQAIHSAWLKTTMMDLFLVGSILIMALYHLGLYLIHRREKSTLYFSLFCLFVVIRIMTTGNYLVNHILDLQPLLIVRLEYITFFMGGFFFASFLYSIFPRDLHLSVVRTFQISALVLTLVTIFAPIIVFTYAVLAFQLLTLLGGAYSLVILVVAILKKRESAIAFLVGWFILFASILNDILYTNYLVDTGHFAGLGLFSFIFSQAFLLSSRFSKAFRQTEKLTEELDYTNKNLERIVANRTSSLQEANEELQSLNEFKEAMAGMVVHDLKNPLNAIINLTEQVTIKDAGKQMLDLVTNILDIQKLETAQLNLRQTGVNL